MGRWGDAHTVFYRDFDWSKVGGWHTLNVSTGQTRSLAIKASSLRLAVSPDGRRLAYDDAARTPALYVYDIAAGAEKRLATGHVHAVWLADDRIAVTSAKACVTETDECMHGEWKETGRVSSFDLNGKAEPIDGLESTMHAEVLFAAPQTGSAPKPTPTPTSSPSQDPSPSPAPTESPVVVPSPVITPVAEPSGTREATP